MPEKEYNYFTKDITITYSDGTKKRHKVRGKTKKELNQKIDDLKIRAATGELRPNSDMLLSTWAKIWLETYKKPSVSAAQYKKYLIVEKNYLPIIGNISLDKLTPLDIQNFINGFENKSKDYISFGANFIKSCLKKADENRLINSASLMNFSKPKGTFKGRRPLTAEERQAFIKVMDKHTYGLMFGIILACGLRPQEVRALQKPDINMDTGEISITRAIKSDSVVGLPKSDAGTRITIMPQWYFIKFKNYIKTVKGNYVFGGEKFITKQHFKRSWQSFLRLMDIELGATLYRNKIAESKLIDNLTPYFLRHTYCTDLARAGVPLKTAQYLMGHSTPTLTARVYQHYQEDTKFAAITALNQFQIAQINDKKCDKNFTNT